MINLNPTRTVYITRETTVGSFTLLYNQPNDDLHIRSRGIGNQGVLVTIKPDNDMRFACMNQHADKFIKENNPLIKKVFARTFKGDSRLNSEEESVIKQVPLLEFLHESIVEGVLIDQEIRRLNPDLYFKRLWNLRNNHPLEGFDYSDAHALEGVGIETLNRLYQVLNLDCEDSKFIMSVISNGELIYLMKYSPTLPNGETVKGVVAYYPDSDKVIIVMEDKNHFLIPVNLKEGNDAFRIYLRKLIKTIAKYQDKLVPLFDVHISKSNIKEKEDSNV